MESMNNKSIPYGKQSIDEQDIEAVCNVLRSDWLTTGPSVTKFEESLADFVGATYGVAVSSGTAALHCAMYALGIGQGDEVIIPAMTFAATANSVVFQRGTPVFADVDPDTLLIDIQSIESLITAKTKAIVAVDFAGQPCDYDALRKISDRHNLILIADSCHSLGAEYHGKRIGTQADMTIFSFHPVKPITTGEGGMVVTENKEYAERMRLFRNHGISTDFREREKKGLWQYEMIDLGFNYRISDIQCALGTSQLRKLPVFLKARNSIARMYKKRFESESRIRPLETLPEVYSAWHLYVVKLLNAEIRARAFNRMRKAGIGVNVHYIPVHLHPYYRKTFSTSAGDCPVAEKAYQSIMTLPIWPGMVENDVTTVVETLMECVV